MIENKTVTNENEIVSSVTDIIVKKLKEEEKKVEGIRVIDADIKINVITQVQHNYNEEAKTLCDNVFELYENILDSVKDTFLKEGCIILDMEEGEENLKVLSHNGGILLSPTKIKELVKSTKQDYVICKL